MEMLLLLAFKTKRNLPWPSMAMSPPSNRSGIGNPVIGLSSPVCAALVNPDTTEVGEFGWEP